EALERPGLAVAPLELVNIGKVAGTRHRQADGVDRDFAALQSGVGERGRVLDRLVVILGCRPIHQCFLRPAPMFCNHLERLLTPSLPPQRRPDQAARSFYWKAGAL